MIATRLRGLAAFIILAAFTIGTPLALIAVDAIPRFDAFSWGVLMRRDDGTVFLAALTIAAWVAWAAWTVSVALSIFDAIRDFRAPRLTRYIPHTTTSRLVASAALLFVSVPTVVPLLPTGRALASPPPDPVDQSPTTAATPIPTSAPLPKASDDARTTPTISYRVQRGDSLWKIAENHLGSGDRFKEIVALNLAQLGDRPGFLQPGLILRLPTPPEPKHTAPPIEDERYVVQAGDTLSEIAADELGDAEKYPEIYEASTGTTQSDGDRLTDPDLIRPGWTLTIPSDTTPPTAPPPSDASTPPTPTPKPPAPPIQEAPHSPAPAVPAAPAEPATPASSAPAAAENSTTAQETDETAYQPPWLLPGLAGAGGLLAGGLLLVVRQHRRTQRRYRLPGQIIAPPPRDLLPVEKTIQTIGPGTHHLIERLDLLLRALPADRRPMLKAVKLGGGRITLHIADEESAPVRPWTSSDGTWTTTGPIPADPEAADRPAPYPLLASVGQDPAGHLWLINLEHSGVQVLTGDTTHAEALTRHLATELAVSPWSTDVEVETLGLGAEIADIDPVRMRHHPLGDTAFLDRFADDLDASSRLTDSEDDPDRFRILIATAGSESVRRVGKAIGAHPGRPGAAVVFIDAEPYLRAPLLNVTADGTLDLADLGITGVRVRAAGLSIEEAEMCARIVRVTDEAHCVAIPVRATTAAPLNDSGVAVHAEDDVRSADEAPEEQIPAAEAPDPPVDPPSRTDVATNSHPDPKRLNGHRTVEPKNDGPTSDRAKGPLPKLAVLGPVTVTAHGDAAAVAARRPYHTEVLAYLALHPAGVTRDQLIEAVGVPRSRVRAVIASVRAWLGTNPRTGKPHLPSALESRAALATGQPTYQVDDLLVDFDLFRRLRARGQARGADGIGDLVEALRLATGVPFSNLRRGGWSWLLDDDLDQIAAAAVTDVAHIVTTHALATDDFDLADFSTATALKVAPDDDISRLDHVALLQARGHYDLAKKEIDDHIIDRADDYRGPIELPPRTAEVVERLLQRQPPQFQGHETSDRAPR